MKERSRLTDEAYERFVSKVKEGKYEGKGWERAVDSVRMTLIRALLSEDIGAEEFVEVVGERSEELLGIYRRDVEISGNGEVEDWEEFELMVGKVEEEVRDGRE